MVAYTLSASCEGWLYCAVHPYNHKRVYTGQFGSLYVEQPLELITVYNGNQWVQRL